MTLKNWQARAEAWNATAPLCACGCALQVRITGPKGLYRNRKYLPGHNSRRASLSSLSLEETSIILGTLLGDSSISRAHQGSHPRLSFTHGEPQVGYATHKMQQLSRLAWRSRFVVSQGYKPGSLLFQGFSSCTPALEGVWDLTRSVGVKYVTQAWLDRLNSVSLAYWFMDDGSASWSPTNLSFVAFHTEGYSIIENERIRDWFHLRGYLRARVAYSKGKPYIYLPRQDGWSLFDEVGPYLHSTMLYKINPPQVKLLERSL